MCEETVGNVVSRSQHIDLPMRLVLSDYANNLGLGVQAAAKQDPTPASLIAPAPFPFLSTVAQEYIRARQAHTCLNVHGHSRATRPPVCADTWLPAAARCLLSAVPPRHAHAPSPGPPTLPPDTAGSGTIKKGGYVGSRQGLSMVVHVVCMAGMWCGFSEPQSIPHGIVNSHEA